MYLLNLKNPCMNSAVLFTEHIELLNNNTVLNLFILRYFLNSLSLVLNQKKKTELQIKAGNEHTQPAVYGCSSNYF